LSVRAGEDAVTVGKQELLNEAGVHRLTELRRAHGLTQRQVPDGMGVIKAASPRSNKA